jgi:hypothetical protein
MTNIDLKELPNLGSDEGLYASGADRANGGQHRELRDAIVEVSPASHAPKREAPTLVRGFGAAGGLGMW